MIESRSSPLIFIPLIFILLLISACDKPAAENIVIRIGTYNVQNMFDDCDDPGKSDDPPTPDTRLRALASVIVDIDCDIIALQEVENIEILEKFNDEYLSGMYNQIILVEGNDPRGIDVAVLSRLNISEINSYRDYQINTADHGTIHFSRDLLAVKWLAPDGQQWNILTTHLKSGATDVDVEKRTLQARAIAGICSADGYVSFLGRGNTILLGDLNAEPWAEDLQAISSVPFSDPAKDLPYRQTHRSGKVLDYILLAPGADTHYMIGSFTIYREGLTEIASDHYPIYLDLQF
jgi:endonuclease/exonuclease/phosphatase family metal-dependent hydrolase